MEVVTTSNMKNILRLLSSLVLSAVLVQPAFSQSESSDYPAPSFSPDSAVSVAQGMSREVVMLTLGLPSETLGATVWIYWDFKGRGAPDAAKYDTLLLVFNEGRVSAMRLCDSKPVRELIAKQRQKSGVKEVARK